MKKVLKSLLVLSGMVIALQAGAAEAVGNDYYLLADGQNSGEGWHLYQNTASGKMEIKIDLQCGNDIRHWVEDGRIVVSESGPDLSSWTKEVVCFRAGSDNPLPSGSPVPKIYFFRHTMYGCFGISVSLSLADYRYGTERRPGGRISANFRTRYPTKPIFFFDRMFSDLP